MTHESIIVQESIWEFGKNIKEKSYTLIEWEDDNRPNSPLRDFRQSVLKDAIRKNKNTNRSNA